MRGTWRGGSYTGDTEGYVEEGSCDGHLFPWGPQWGTWKGTLTGDFERQMNGALEVGCLSLRELCEGNLEGDTFNGNPGGCVKGPRWGAGGLSTGN